MDITGDKKQEKIQELMSKIRDYIKSGSNEKNCNYYNLVWNEISKWIDDYIIVMGYDLKGD